MWLLEEEPPGHVFSQRQQNAFIKPIRAKSCGTQPHFNFHYCLSGDSHLHPTWRTPPPQPAPLSLPWLSPFPDSFINFSQQEFVNPQLHNDNPPLSFVLSDQEDLHGNSNGRYNSVSLGHN